jgi:cell division septum initiation protein DivIVA
METKYQIFISSTYTDLISVRQKVRDTILSLYHFPVGMEMFSADDDEQWDVIKETIDSSDYYVLILGHRYGSETSEGISFTEKEYNYAKSKELPVLAFIRDRDVAVKSNERDDDPEKIKKLSQFIQKAQSNKMCDFWITPEELTTKVSIALHKMFKKKPRPGWIRSDNLDFAQISQEVVKLSQENRDLREENERLKGQLGAKKPIIELNINEGKAICIQYKKTYDNYGMEIHKINYEDVPIELQKYVTKGDIEKYNSALPKKDEIDKYIKEMILYKRINETGLDFNLSVINNGTVKATNVYIDITFPEELKIMSKWDIRQYKKPNVDIPKNPIIEAYNKHTKGIFGLTPEVINNIISNTNLIMGNNLNLISPIKNNIFSNDNSWLKDNTLTIKINGVVQTREFKFVEEYKIIPFQTGVFDLKVDIICEEYEQKNTLFIPVIVEEVNE